MKHIESFNSYELIFEQQNIIIRDGDPYEYKVENGKWFARARTGMKYDKGAGKNPWYDITKPKFQKSIDRLDDENPTERNDDAPLKKKKKTKPRTKKELLEALRLRINEGIEKVNKSNKPRYEVDEICKKIDEEVYEGYNENDELVENWPELYQIYNHTAYFWPIFEFGDFKSNNYPSATYETFKDLFENYWSKRNHPPNWDRLHKNFINRLKSGAINLFPKGCSRYNDFVKYCDDHGVSKVHKDRNYYIWSYNFDNHSYGFIESSWLREYAFHMGLIGEYQNLYEYYESLPE